MLTKRIIPCLDVKNGRTVKGINFVGLRDAGDPVQLAAQYAAQGADEVVFLDITATVEKRQTLVALARSVAQELDIPFTIGGGVQSVADAEALLYAGADKVAVNSAAVARPQLVTELAAAVGSQSVVVAIDARWEGATSRVVVHGGRTLTDWETSDWAHEAVARGAGEILLTSMDTDGTNAGYDLRLQRLVKAAVTVPVVASGGAGTAQHFVEVLQNDYADAALAASIFHFGTLPIPRLKAELHAAGVPVRYFAV